VLNKAPRHEDVWGNGGIAPLLLDLRSRWRWTVSLSGLGSEEKEILSLPLLENELRSSNP
jgi:hypothetical protein